ncbi:hypothetical protein EQW78_10950 [Oerskovia turbata]|uniref:Uncharacterized protein n=1 Tax=Oerskovia turbata TaxID=1713 RepID=A0A4Q1KUB5_9CELL|nr:hypothetical protein [Oerskovia turbata]RXR23727.1 hypothetical protein EQW73_13950 [Oerskovia turbata]RXR33803.1 hypothetical protein EQW78_10950 [Oerskovia turbata]TGJ96787.1 hypothetical protein DLJ96_01560 [Actinotalea fermentans ATCC 43279 = JCM 9966 = DSM 3133]
MGVLSKALAGGAAILIGAGIRALLRDAQETKRRKSSPLQFDDGLAAQDFAHLASEVASRTPRVTKADVTGMTVGLVVRSNSGLTTWSAEIDFNDYGRLTGAYWLTSENDQSPIPTFFADALQDEIYQRVASRRA